MSTPTAAPLHASARRVIPQAGRSASRADRRVGAGDEHEDHRVVQVLHQPLGADRPLTPVIGGAHAVETGECRGEDHGCHPGGRGSGQRHERDPRRDRHEERDLMETAPQRRPGHVRRKHRRTLRRASVAVFAGLSVPPAARRPASAEEAPSACRPAAWDRGHARSPGHERPGAPAPARPRRGPESPGGGRAARSTGRR